MLVTPQLGGCSREQGWNRFLSSRPGVLCVFLPLFPGPGALKNRDDRKTWRTNHHLKNTHTIRRCVIIAKEYTGLSTATLNFRGKGLRVPRSLPVPTSIGGFHTEALRVCRNLDRIGRSARLEERRHTPSSFWGPVKPEDNLCGL